MQVSRASTSANEPQSEAARQLHHVRSSAFNYSEGRLTCSGGVWPVLWVTVQEEHRLVEETWLQKSNIYLASSQQNTFPLTWSEKHNLSDWQEAQVVKCHVSFIKVCEGELMRQSAQTTVYCVTTLKAFWFSFCLQICTDECEHAESRMHSNGSTCALVSM